MSQVSRLAASGKHATTSRGYSGIPVTIFYEILDRTCSENYLFCIGDLSQIPAQTGSKYEASN